MVAYSFQSSFLSPIAAREKRQTIRLPRKRHARPGEALQLFYALIIDGADGLDALSDFAIRDGFRPNAALAAKGVCAWEFMALWWRMTHPDQPVFRGVLIDWADTFIAADPVVREEATRAV